MDNASDKDSPQPMTSKFSEFLRTFQHHRTLSLLCIDEVRFRVKFLFIQPKGLTLVLCNVNQIPMA
jgi:hypothetical protein